jgi:hypothetical protein
MYFAETKAIEVVGKLMGLGKYGISYGGRNVHSGDVSGFIVIKYSLPRELLCWTHAQMIM